MVAAGAGHERCADNASYLHGPGEGAIDEWRYDPANIAGANTAMGSYFSGEATFSTIHPMNPLTSGFEEREQRKTCATTGWS